MLMVQYTVAYIIPGGIILFCYVAIGLKIRSSSRERRKIVANMQTSHSYTSHGRSHHGPSSHTGTGGGTCKSVLIIHAHFLECSRTIRSLKFNAKPNLTNLTFWQISSYHTIWKQNNKDSCCASNTECSEHTYKKNYTFSSLFFIIVPTIENGEELCILVCLVCFFNFLFPRKISYHK